MAFNKYISSWLSGVDFPSQLPLKQKRAMSDPHHNSNSFKRFVLIEQVQNAPSSPLGFCCGQLELTSTPFFSAQSDVSLAPSSKSSPTRADNFIRRLLKLKRANPPIYCEFIDRLPRNLCSASISVLRIAFGKNLHTKFILVHFKVHIHLL